MWHQVFAGLEDELLTSGGLGGGVTVTNASEQLCLDANEALQSEEQQL